MNLDFHKTGAPSLCSAGVLAAPEHFKMNCNHGDGHALSLSLTLSRWEREQSCLLFASLSAARSNPTAGFRMTLGTFRPLPAGEGRGEISTKLISHIEPLNLDHGCIGTYGRHHQQRAVCLPLLAKRGEGWGEEPDKSFDPSTKHGFSKTGSWGGRQFDENERLQLLIQSVSIRG